MSVDVCGLQKGCFHASWWTFRPVIALASFLGFDTQGWDTNDEGGLKTQEECDALARAILNYLDKSRLTSDDYLWANYGGWKGEERVSGELLYTLNEFCPLGSLVQQGISTPQGIVYPKHSISVGELMCFVDFLRESGGFEIR